MYISLSLVNLRRTIERTALLSPPMALQYPVRSQAFPAPLMRTKVGSVEKF